MAQKHSSKQMNGSSAMAMAMAAVLLLGAMGATPAQSQPVPEGYLRNPSIEPGLAPSMTVEEQSSVSNTYSVQFGVGDEILSGLTDLAKERGIASGQITGLGGLSSALLAFGDPSIGDFVFKLIPIDEKNELVSLVGTVSLRNGEPSVHLHAVVALSDGSTRGGHVLELHVAPIAEISILETSSLETGSD